MPIHPVLREIHRFWFGDIGNRMILDTRKTDMWFTQSDDTDRHIRERFGAFLQEAAATEWDLEKLNRPDAVALVVLLDQFPRNLFRDSAEAFAYDDKALQVATRLLDASGADRFFWIEQAALGLPFEHSEQIVDQNFSVMYFARLVLQAPELFHALFNGQLDYATKHRDIIRRFGRFPHRNAVLGRESTPEELAFLAEKGRGY